MASEQVKYAIQLIKNNQHAEARRILLEEVRRDPGQENAWLWLATTMQTDQQRIAVLREALTHHPDSELARKSLQTLTGKTAPEIEEPEDADLIDERLDAVAPVSRPPTAPPPPAAVPARRRRRRSSAGGCFKVFFLLFIGILVGAAALWAVEKFLLPPNFLDPKSPLGAPTPTPLLPELPTIPPTTTPTAVVIPAGLDFKVLFTIEGSLSAFSSDGKLTALAQGVNAAGISPDGSLVAFDNGEEIWLDSISGGSPRRLIGLPELQSKFTPTCQFLDLHWQAGSGYLIVPCQGGGAGGLGLDLYGFALVKPENGEVASTLVFNASSVRVIYSEDGQMAALAGADGSLILLNLSNGAHLDLSLGQINPEKLPVSPTWGGARWSNDNLSLEALVFSDPYQNPGESSAEGSTQPTYVLLRATLDGRLTVAARFTDWPGGEMLQSAQLFSPNGQLALYPLKSGLSLVDMKTGAQTLLSLPDNLAAKPLAWSPDSSAVLINSEDGRVFLYEIGGQSAEIASGKQWFISDAAWVDANHILLSADQLYLLEIGGEPQAVAKAAPAALIVWTKASAAPAPQPKAIAPTPTAVPPVEKAAATVYLHTAAGILRLNSTAGLDSLVSGDFTAAVFTSDASLAAYTQDGKLWISPMDSAAAPVEVKAAPDKALLPEFTGSQEAIQPARYAWQTGPTTLVVEYKASLLDMQTILGYALVNPETGLRRDFVAHSETGTSIFAPNGRTVLVVNAVSLDPALSLVNLNNRTEVKAALKLPLPALLDTPRYLTPYIQWAQNSSEVYAAFYLPQDAAARTPCQIDCTLSVAALRPDGSVVSSGQIPGVFDGSALPVMAISGNGQFAAYSAADGTHLYDFSSKTDRVILPLRSTSLVWAPGSERLAAASEDGRAAILTTDGKAEIFGGDGEEVSDLVWADSNTLVYLQSENGRWNLTLKNAGEEPQLLSNQLGRSYPRGLFAFPAQ